MDILHSQHGWSCDSWCFVKQD